ncbi:ATP-binding cassette domain-containing protein [Paenibacillus xylaniclasticus]|uniref:ATP-binding cassette domain-containing protein n=1 Tax=Paenibacillus xylaniclasticus TaxID=588083 RepID=UPI001C3FD235|nr:MULTISPECIES: ATP-binding cassette domain-containing protein [Paenibacillus]
MSTSSKAFADQRVQLSQTLYEMLSAQVELRTNSAEQWGNRRVEASVAIHNNTLRQFFNFMNLRNATRGFFQYLGAIATILYGVHLVVNNELTVGEMSSFLIYFFIAMQNMTNLISLSSEQRSIIRQAQRRACQIVQLEDFIRSLPFGLETVIGERGITLSGVQRQRLAAARALLRPTELLILDEATSALDLETERRFQAMLKEERKGKTTVIVAHRLSTVRDADLIIVMDKGRLVEKGSHQQLMSNGSYYRRLVEEEYSPEKLLL